MDDEVFRQKELDAKIARLRERVRQLPPSDRREFAGVLGIVLGILDLLGDEL